MVCAWCRGRRWPTATPVNQVEPGAGTWPTWPIASGADLRLPPPPGPSDTQAALADLQTLAAQRDGATLDCIGYWDAGAPPYRWTQRTVKYVQDHN